MTRQKEASPPPTEGLRARKRRQSLERITNAAIPLFLKKGYDATTIDEIAAAADVSKRTFFDYFATKEEVVFAWQDELGSILAEEMRARPVEEPLILSAEKALLASTARITAHPQIESIHLLISKTSALQARNNLKYIKLEQTLAEALIERMHDEDGYFRARLLAAIIISGFRIAPEKWRASPGGKDEASIFVKKVLRTIWMELREFGQAAPLSLK